MSFEDRLAHLDVVLDLLAQNGFRLYVVKCQFASNSFKFLGFLVTPYGILPDPGKVEAILKMQPLQTLRQVCQSSGATVFFHRHMENYVMLAGTIN